MNMTWDTKSRTIFNLVTFMHMAVRYEIEMKGTDNNDCWSLDRRELLSKGAFLGTTTKLGATLGISGMGVSAAAAQSGGDSVIRFPDFDGIDVGALPDGWSVRDTASGSNATVEVTADAIRGERSLLVNGQSGGWSWVQTDLEGSGVEFSCNFRRNYRVSSHHQVQLFTEEWAIGFGSTGSGDAFDLAYASRAGSGLSGVNFQDATAPDERVDDVFDWEETVDVAVRGVESGFEVRIDGETVLQTDDEYDPSSSIQIRSDDVEARFDAPEGRSGARYVLEQGGETYEIEPLSYEDLSVEDFYDYRGIRASANTPTGVEAGPETSKLFLYEGPEGLSLVVVHDDHNYPNATSSGGHAVFDFEGLEGSWVVEDDPGDWDRSGSSPPDTIDWRWNSRNTDGGAFRFDDESLDVTVTPDFRSGIDQWEFLSDEPDDPERIDLDPTQPVTIRRGIDSDAKVRPSDEAIATRRILRSVVDFEHGERGSSSMVVDDTETLFHEFFALKAGSGEVVTSYDPEVTVTEEFEAINPPLPGLAATLEVPIAGTTVEVRREVTVDLDRPRVTVDYDLELTESQSTLDLTLYTAADFDVAGPDGDAAHYHDDGDFLHVEDTSDESDTLAGIAGDAVPDEHDLIEYPAYEAVESGDLGGADEFPASSAGGDAVAVVGFDLGTLKSGDLPRAPGSTRLTQQVRLGAAESVEELRDVLDRRVDLSFVEPRLAQSVEDTRLVDPSRSPTATLRRIDDPPMVEGKSTVPLFDLDVAHLETLDWNQDVELTVRTLGDSGTHPGRVLIDQFDAPLERSDLQYFEGDRDALWVLQDIVPSFGLTDGLTAVQLSIGTGDDHANGDRITLEIDEHFETESMDVLRIGFVPLEEPPGANLYRNGAQGFLNRYDTLVEEATELVERMYPVPEVRAYAHPDLVESSDHDDSDCALIEDGRESRDVLVDQTPIAASDTVRGTGSIEKFDATIAITPDDYLNHHGRNAGGLHKSDPEAAAFGEIDNGAGTVAHEFGHHFSGDLYEEPPDHELAQRDGGPDVVHARHPNSDVDSSTPVDEPGIELRKVDVGDSSLDDTDGDAHSLMSYGSNRWIDSFQYNDIIAHDLEPHPRSDWKRDRTRRAVNAGYCFVDGLFERMEESFSIETDTTVKVHGDGDLSLEVLGPEGETLSSHQSRPYTEYTAQGEHSDDVLQAVYVRVPFPEDAVHLEASYDGETVTTNVLAESLRSAIAALPDEAFDGPSKRRRSLMNKLAAVETQIDRGAYRGAANKLRNDVRKQLAKWIRDDWAGTAQTPSRSELLDLVERRVSDLETLSAAN